MDYKEKYFSYLKSNNQIRDGWELYEISWDALGIFRTRKETREKGYRINGRSIQLLLRYQLARMKDETSSLM